MLEPSLSRSRLWVSGSALRVAYKRGGLRKVWLHEILKAASIIGEKVEDTGHANQDLHIYPGQSSPKSFLKTSLTLSLS